MHRTSRSGSGRRKTETIDVDTVILAIGQRVNAEGMNGVELTRKGGLVYDKDTYMTALPGVFAGGDCGNDKISIAVESIGDAKKELSDRRCLSSRRRDQIRAKLLCNQKDVTPATFEDRERMCRPTMEQLNAEERKDNFTEVVFGYDEEQAVEEAHRCLECGCKDYF